MRSRAFCVSFFCMSVSFYTYAQSCTSMRDYEMGLKSGLQMAPPCEIVGTLPKCQGEYNVTTWSACYGERRIPGGASYRGQYLQGRANGKGEFVNPDGSRYVGGYSTGQRSGTGREYDSKGQLAKQGQWERGVYLGLSGDAAKAGDQTPVRYQQFSQAFGDADRSDAAAKSPQNTPTTEFNFKSEFAYQGAIGNPGVQGKSASPDLFRKKLGTSIGHKITLPDFFLWKLDSREWTRGGKLYVMNDDSLGPEYGVQCELSPADGDRIMKTRSRRAVDVTGVIKSYSISRGLVIDPCHITWDETEGPKRKKS
jgi:hypothetical protein